MAINEKDHSINQNVNNLEHETQRSSTTNNKESLHPTDISEETNEEDNVVDSDKKDNSINLQQKEIIYSDDTITSSDATVFIQKSESSKTNADKAVADKAESNTSFQPINIKKTRYIKNFWIEFSRLD